MIEKWKKWVLKMNLKRAALIFVVSSVVFNFGLAGSNAWSF